jgi:hypothetical protein
VRYGGGAGPEGSGAGAQAWVDGLRDRSEGLDDCRELEAAEECRAQGGGERLGEGSGSELSRVERPAEHGVEGLGRVGVGVRQRRNEGGVDVGTQPGHGSEAEGREGRSVGRTLPGRFAPGADQPDQPVGPKHDGVRGECSVLAAGLMEERERARERQTDSAGKGHGDGLALIGEREQHFVQGQPCPELVHREGLAFGGVDAETSEEPRATG